MEPRTEKRSEYRFTHRRSAPSATWTRLCSTESQASQDWFSSGNFRSRRSGKSAKAPDAKSSFSYTAHSAYVTADNAICPNIFPEEAQTGANASRPAGHFTTLLTTAGKCSSATRPCSPSRTTTCCTASKTSPMQVWTLSRSRAGSRTFHT